MNSFLNRYGGSFFFFWVNTSIFARPDEKWVV
jgi:hypothetical protein